MQHDRDIWNKIILSNGIIWKKNCPFCWIDENEKKLLIFETNFWEIRYNKYPYGWVKKHLLVLPKRHIGLAKELDDTELLDLKNIHNFLYKFYEWKKYFSFLRETFEWRSIKHLHYHYLPWNIYGSDFATILNKQWH